MPSRISKRKPEVELEHGWTFEAIGTLWWIGLYEPLKDTALVYLRQQVANCIETFDRTYSRFRDDSVVTEMSKKAGTYELPSDANALFKHYRTLYDISDGMVTPLIGQVMSDIGYDATYSLQPKQPVTPPAWNDILEVRDSTIHIKQPALLDFGAAGKGYLVDEISELLVSTGVSRFCIDAGGDIRSSNAPDLRIGLEDPRDSGSAIGVITLQTGALCASAGNRRKWAGYHHIMNPRTLQSAQDIQAVWVTADEAMTADGLATALFFTAPKLLQDTFTFEYCIMHSDGSVRVSSGFQGTLFTEGA